ncbi:MAG: glycoside hydrolase family 2 TIM barrel-domain containing protein [Gammaproteobacteria bacterium]
MQGAIGALRGGLAPGLLLCVLCGPVRAATHTDLDHDWLFRADPERSGEAAGWNSTIPMDTESVSLPHTWNIGRLHDYLGVAWYFRRFEMPSLTAGAHIELHFGATFYVARVWLNGRELGRHKGGFTAYSFDVTPYLRATNVLSVQIDNRPGIATIPGFAERGTAEARYDWWTYGGMVRGVWLTTTGSAWIERQQIRTAPSAGGAQVSDHVHLQSAFGEPTPVQLRVTVTGPDNRVAASDTRSVSLQPGASEITVSLPIANPKLWRIDQPNLYRMRLQLEDRGHALLDESGDTFGVRSVQIRDRHLLINGERVRLTGMARHEDSPWEGLAETRGTIWHDYDDMKLLHTTLSRPVHYPQNPLVLDYADRHGILLIPEIPVWQFSEAQLADPRVLGLAKQQMREMIEEAGNHPSIFGWSVANESAMGTPAGIAYFRAMRDMIRTLDPERFVSFADDNLPKLERAESSAANDADFIMMNQYFGSWHGPAAALAPALDRMEALFPHKMVIISEMGFAGIFAKDPVQADLARVKTLQEQMPMLAARDWIAGAILWCYQDYKSPRNLWPGETEGYVDHGLVDEWRQRKPSYGTWKRLTVPSQLTARWEGAAGSAPSGFTVVVTPNSAANLPYYPLHDYRLTWKITDAKGVPLIAGMRPLTELVQAVTVNGNVPPNQKDPPLRLSVTLQAPSGAAAVEENLDWPARPEQR